jgi:hypothetical protein
VSDICQLGYSIEIVGLLLLGIVDRALDLAASNLVILLVSSFVFVTLSQVCGTPL